MKEPRAALPYRPSGILVVAPLDAAWPDATSAWLTERGYAVARMHALSLMGFLITSAGVAGALVDAALIGRGSAVACLRAIRRLQPQLRVVGVGQLASDELERVAAPHLTAVLDAVRAVERLGTLFPELRGPHRGGSR